MFETTTQQIDYLPIGEAQGNLATPQYLIYRDYHTKITLENSANSKKVNRLKFFFTTTR